MAEVDVLKIASALTMLMILLVAWAISDRIEALEKRIAELEKRKL